jgi:hypothetical protein
MGAGEYSTPQEKNFKEVVMNLKNVNDFVSDLSKLVKEYEPEARGSVIRVLMSAEEYNAIREEFSEFERHPPKDWSAGSIRISGDTWRFEIIGRGTHRTPDYLVQKKR